MTAVAAVVLVPVTFVLAVVGHGLWRDQPVDPNPAPRWKAIKPKVTISPLDDGHGWEWLVWWQTGQGRGPCKYGKTWTKLGARFAAWRVAR
jgi:hypothetical protein